MRFSYVLVAGLALGISGQAYATASNDPPPVGNVIYQLTGQTISSTYQTASATFVAGATATNLAFAFREDPAFVELSDVSMVDLTTSGPNLVSNGDFSLGLVGSSAPTDWAYLNTFGASSGGTVKSGCGLTANNCYYDGAVQAYDAINQVIDTDIGDTYQVTFSYADNGPSGTYQSLSTDGDTTGTGGNGRDMFVYAGNTVPVRAPEPASFAVLGTALLGLGMLRWRQKV